MIQKIQETHFTENLLLKLDLLIYVLYRVLLRVLMGKEKRNQYMKKRKITVMRFLFGNPIIKLDGIKMKVRKDSYDYDVIRDKHEESIIGLLKLNENETYLDIGANIGAHVIRVAKSNAQKKNIRFIAVEPDESTFKILKQNVKLNKIPNVTLINKLIYSRKENIPFYILESKSDFNGIYREYTDYERKVIMQADTIDSILKQNEIDRIDVVKIDVESAEIDVLTGAKKLLKVARRIVVEVHIREYDNYDRFKAVEKILSENGFKVEKIQIKHMMFALGTKS